MFPEGAIDIGQTHQQIYIEEYILVYLYRTHKKIELKFMVSVEAKTISHGHF